MNETMSVLLPRFLDWLKVHNYSEHTILSRRKYVPKFLAWARERGVEYAIDATRPVLERFQRHLHLYRKRNGDPLSNRSQIHHIAALRSFFRWLTRERYVPANVASELIMPRREFRLPANVMTPSQVEQVLAMPDIKTHLGLRDRAIMETLYSTGIRRAELLTLTPQDLDRERGLLLVILGKNKKDRVIPIGARALAWIDRYMEEVRPLLLVGHQPDDALFVSITGRPMTPNSLSLLVGGYVKKAGVKQKGACHNFRHAMATAMLENGADVRYVQEMLGHANLETTAIYTHVMVSKLKEVHEATHPAKMKRADVDKDKPGP